MRNNLNYENSSENSNGEYCLKIYSVKSKNIIFNLRKKIKIDNFISNKKFLGVSFIDKRIEIFETINYNKILKIKCDNNLSYSRNLNNNFSHFDNLEKFG